MPSVARRFHVATVSLREAKRRLVHLAKQAGRGTRVIITSHGTAIADLVQHETDTAQMDAMKRPGRLPRLIRLKGKGPTASKVVLMDREG